MSLSRSAFGVFEATKSFFLSWAQTETNRQATLLRSIHNKHSEIAQIQFISDCFLFLTLAGHSFKWKPTKSSVAFAKPVTITCTIFFFFISCVLLHVGINCAKSLRALTCAHKSCSHGRVVQATGIKSKGSSVDELVSNKLSGRMLLSNQTYQIYLLLIGSSVQCISGVLQ